MVCAVPRAAIAAGPDPVLAGLLSAGSTLLPITIAGGLLGTGRGSEEGIRFDVSLTCIALGSIAGPSVGQIYASGGSDAIVTFVLRILTGAVMTTGLGFWLRSQEPERERTGRAMFILGAIPTTFLGVWDWFGAASSAKQTRYRQGHAQRSDLTPELDPELVSLMNCPGPIPCGI